MSRKKRFTSVWDAIEETPQQAASLRTLRGQRHRGLLGLH